MDAAAIELFSITKQFPGVQALNSVSMTIQRGEIIALMGENGAGKSTLVKILSGVYPYGTYKGRFLVGGREAYFHTTRDSLHAGISVIYQELELIKELTVAENIFLGRLHRSFGIIDWNRVHFEAEALLKSFGVHVDLTKRICEIGIGQQQLVEIAKALSYKSDILILDEPTAALTESEVALLMKILRRLKKSGVTCILISHKLNEVLEIADRITVLRDGRHVGTANRSDLDENSIIKMMVGRTLTQMFPNKTTSAGKVVLAVRDFTKKTPLPQGRTILSNISFEVRTGEILGIAGLMGAGRTELLMSLFGFLEGESSGEISVHGRPVKINEPRAAIAHGFGIVTEDRKRFGLIAIETVARNATLASMEQISLRGVLNKEREASLTQHYVDKLGIKTASVSSWVGTLSGGNQQKVLLARSLMTKPVVLFLDEPTRGIDIGAKHEIYLLMNQLVENGTAIIMVSSELPEILGMSDRILVMHEGLVAGELSRADATQEKIMLLASRGKYQ